jgi:hypothetical protein
MGGTCPRKVEKEPATATLAWRWSACLRPQAERRRAVTGDVCVSGRGKDGLSRGKGFFRPCVGPGRHGNDDFIAVTRIPSMQAAANLSGPG